MVRIVEIIGGLGNQMFQYAFFLYLKNKSHIWDRLYVDIEAMKTYDRHYGLELEKVFNLSLCPISNGLHRNLQKRSFAKPFEKVLQKSKSFQLGPKSQTSDKKTARHRDL